MSDNQKEIPKQLNVSLQEKSYTENSLNQTGESFQNNTPKPIIISDKSEELYNEIIQ